MYLYFDVRGDIKGITPLPDKSLEQFDYTTIPLTQVEKFLTGQANPFDYQMKIVNKKPVKLIKKEIVTVKARDINYCLTEISTTKNYNASILFKLDCRSSSLTITPSKELISLYNSKDDDDAENREELERLVQGINSTVYITEFKNPYNLYSSFIFNVKELFDNSLINLTLDENIDYSNTSMYTKKLFENYELKIVRGSL